MKIFKKILTGVITGAMMCSLMQTVPVKYGTAAVAEAAGAVNILDYESNTSASEYAIYDVAGMEKLADLVNEKGVTFEGKKISLEKDLMYDKSKENNHIPIGKTENRAFSGSFDGKNHVITGINIKYVGDRTQNAYIGLFGYVLVKNSDLVIQSIRLADSIMIDDSSSTEGQGGCGHSMGGIIGLHKHTYNSTGKSSIKDCRTNRGMKISANYDYTETGGIAGQVYGESDIVRCVNNAEVFSNDSAGGIASNLDSNVKCENCINFGTIVAKSYAGGIAASVTRDSLVIESCNHGMIQGSSTAGVATYSDFRSQIRNSYNSGTVEKKEYTTGLGGGECAGGLLQSLGQSATVLFNSYSVGKIVITTGQYGGAVCVIGGNGYETEDLPTLKKVYWDGDVNTCGVNMEKMTTILSGKKAVDISLVYQKTSEQMKNQTFVAELNQNSKSEGYGEVWVADTEGINNGYPILKNVPYDGISASDDSGQGNQNNTQGDNGQGNGNQNQNIKPEDDEIPTITTYQEPSAAQDSGAVVAKLFKDYTYKTPVREDSITIYANGGKVTKDGETKDYKSYTLYAKILPSYIYTLDTKKKLKMSAGKVIVGITSSRTTKPVPDKGKIVDDEAAKVAKASIKNGQVTVTAQQKPGTVYLWVMDTGDLSKSEDVAEAKGTYACCPVTVKAAPTEIQTYDTAKGNVTLGTTPKYTKATIDLNNTANVYVCPVYKDGTAVKKTGDGTYSAEVEKNSKAYFDVVKTGAEKFTVIAKDLKDGKKTTGKIIIKNDQNGKKATFTVTAFNRAKNVGLSGAKGVTLGSAGNVSISVSQTAKTSGTVTAALSLAKNAVKTTDAPKIYAMKTANGYDSTEFKKGTVKITAKPEGEQKKITASIGKDKTTITISATKGMKTGQKTYFLLVYNTQDTAQRKGYYVFSVETK